MKYHSPLIQIQMPPDKEGGRKGTRDVAVQEAYLTQSHQKVSLIKNLLKGRDQDRTGLISNKSKKMNLGRLKMMLIKQVWMIGKGKELRGEPLGRRKVGVIHPMEMKIIEVIGMSAIDMIGDPAIESNFHHSEIDFTPGKILTIFSSLNSISRTFQIATTITCSNIRKSKNMIFTKTTNQSHGLSKGTIQARFSCGNLSKWL